MDDKSTEEVKSAAYPESDKDEHDAIDILDVILDSSVKSHTDSRDKTPNHDGWLELVDEDDVPTGKITVQVKKLPDKNRTNPKKRVKTKTLAYCKACIEPFIVIAVDTTNNVAYWEHITPEWFEEENLNRQKTKTIHLDDESRIAAGETNYVSEWQSIIDDTRQRIEDYDEYVKLLEQSNPAIGEHRSKFAHIHQFLDRYHHLIDNDFRIIRKELYPGVWKFGYGDINYGRNNLRYTLYPIKWDENDAQIRDIDGEWDVIHSLGGNIISEVNVANPISDAPQEYAYKAVGDKISNLFSDMKLDYSGCIFAATEYIYDFIQSFAPLLGLENKDRYSISEIRNGYYRHLQFWVSTVIERILKEHPRANVVVRLDSYLRGEFSSKELQALSKAERMTKHADEDPPRYHVSMQDFDQELVERFIDVLVESDQESITKPYPGKDRENFEQGEFLARYTDKGIFENIRAYNEHYHREYRRLLKNNFPTLYDELSKNWTDFLVVVPDRDHLRDREGWSHRWFWLESNNEELRIECRWSDEVDIPSYGTPSAGETMRFSGTEYDIASYGMSGTFQMTDHQLNNQMVLTDITDDLRSEVKSYLDRHGYSYNQNQRE